MSRPDEPYHDPRKPSEASLWKGIGIVVLIVLGVLVAWWAIELAGDPATREPGDADLEPLEPARVQPAPVLPERVPVVKAA